MVCCQSEYVAVLVLEHVSLRVTGSKHDRKLISLCKKASVKVPLVFEGYPVGRLSLLPFDLNSKRAVLSEAFPVCGNTLVIQLAFGVIIQGKVNLLPHCPQCVLSEIHPP